jgi:1-acyl-sn-glycerol-3-phosphate acyltransferase
MTQLSLLRTRRFAAVFWTQFLGAFNDNLLKNALVLLITYHSLTVLGLSVASLVALCGGIFILPFFLFSATAGELADRYPKSRLMQIVKSVEIAIMVGAAIGFWTENLWLLLAALFAMGTHSSIFGPVKYSILPQLLRSDELVAGNALVETGTFLAILLGTIAGGLGVAFGESGLHAVAVSMLAVAAAGLTASLFIPYTPAQNPSVAIAANPLRPTLEAFRLTRKVRSVYLSVLGASWFWFYGAILLALLPLYGRDVLHASEDVVTFFLALFCVGIGAGSMLCERLSGRKLELGLVPFGSIGMTIFVADLFLVGSPVLVAGGASAGIGDLLATWTGWRIALDLTLLSLFSGFFIVPLTTFIQERSDAAERSRVIAGNNILSAAFMVLASAMLAGLLAAGFSIAQIFLVLALLNAAVAAYIYRVIPEFLLRFVAWLAASVLYRLRVVNGERIPLDGPALLVCNHVTFVDWLVISSASKRPVRFVMDHHIFATKGMGWLFRDAKAIPIAPAHENKAMMDAALDRVAAELAEGELVCIFPEGKITKDGEMNPFKSGSEWIVARTPVLVLPMALRGMWGSFFSRKGGKAMSRPFRRFWSRIELVVGEPVAPEQATAGELARRVAELGGFRVPPPARPYVAPGSDPGVAGSGATPADSGEPTALAAAPAQPRAR